MAKPKSKVTPLSAKVWISVVLFGLFGQIAWMLENMYFNVFMDRTVTTNPFAVQLMVALSAIVATATTLVSGTLTDRVGKRKRFICWGYIVWGLTVMIFALISKKNTAAIFGLDPAGQAVITITVSFIVFMDCVMTFVGSFCNDAAFNAWVTDITDETNRGTVEGVLAIMPLMAMAVIFGGFDSLTWNTYLLPDGSQSNIWQEGAVLLSHGKWWLFFVLVGGITTLSGIAGFFLIKDSPKLMPNKEASFKNILYGFKPAVLRENKDLYITYGAMALVGIANMSYLPYIVQYVERTLKIPDYIIPIAAIIVISSIISVVLGLLYDKFGRNKFVIPVNISNIMGAVAMTVVSPLVFDTTPIWLLCIAGVLLMASNLALGAVFASTARDLTPPDKVGLFQGVRMVFWVLLPMVIGPLITAIITTQSSVVGIDEYGQKVYEYTPYMFLVGAGIMALGLPFTFLVKKYLDKQAKPAAEVKE